MDHWISMGYIYQIAFIPPVSIIQGAEATSNADDGKPRSDENLYILLDQIAPGVIKDIMNQFRPPSGQQLGSIEGLMAALELRDKSGDWSSSAYNKDVCLEFHHLLVALLLGYWRSLCRRYESEVNEGKQKEEEKQKAAAERKKNKKVAKGRKVEQGTGGDKGENEPTEETAANARLMDDIFTYSRLLWTVICSRLYHDHSRVMESLFRRPSRDDANSYKEWMGRGEEAGGPVNRAEEKDDNNAGSSGADQAGKGGDDCGGSHATDDGAEDGGGDDPTNDVAEDGGGDDPTDDGAEDGGEDDPADDRHELVEEDTEQVAQGSRPKPEPSAFDMFKAWAKLNTSHFTALYNTSRHNLPEVAFPLIEILPPETPSLDWHKFIRNYMRRRNVDKSIPKALKALQEFIDSGAYAICRLFGRSAGSEAPRQRNLKVGEVDFSGNRHAELDMATSQEFPFPEGWPIDAEALDLIKVRF
jgi:hypothetical protein